jgi:hypothetical protein
MPVEGICRAVDEDEDIPHGDCSYRIDRDETIIYNTGVTRSHFVVVITDRTADGDDYLHPMM